jgi:hypothetical protein
VFKLVKRLGLLALLVGAAYAGFRWGPRVFPRFERAMGWRTAAEESEAGVDPPPTAELADSTLDRFERFRAGDGPARLALGSRELTSVVRFALPGLVPPGVNEPRVELEGSRVRLSARVALAAFPRLPRLDEVVGVLPDTVAVLIEGPLVPYDEGRLALMVDRVEASHLPLPRRLVGDVVAGFRQEAPPGLPEDAISVPVPTGIQAAYVRRDSLVLVAER